jgi:hypothetical protein
MLEMVESAIWEVSQEFQQKAPEPKSAGGVQRVHLLIPLSTATFIGSGIKINFYSNLQNFRFLETNCEAALIFFVPS